MHVTLHPEVEVDRYDQITLLEAAYMLVRMCILIFAKCCGKTEEDEDFDWRKVEPDVTEKRRTICIDCPWRCCRVDEETAEMVR